jgi:hypothetical protein
MNLISKVRSRAWNIQATCIWFSFVYVQTDRILNCLCRFLSLAMYLFFLNSSIIATCIWFSLFNCNMRGARIGESKLSQLVLTGSRAGRLCQKSGGAWETMDFQQKPTFLAVCLSIWVASLYWGQQDQRGSIRNRKSCSEMLIQPPSISYPCCHSLSRSTWCNCDFGPCYHSPVAAEIDSYIWFMSSLSCRIGHLILFSWIWYCIECDNLLLERTNDGTY